MPKIKVKGRTVQPGEHGQTNGQKDGRYQVHYLPASRSIIIVIISDKLVAYLIKKLCFTRSAVMTCQTMLAGMKVSISGTQDCHVQIMCRLVLTLDSKMCFSCVLPDWVANNTSIQATVTPGYFLQWDESMVQMSPLCKSSHSHHMRRFA